VPNHPVYPLEESEQLLKDIHHRLVQMVASMLRIDDREVMDDFANKRALVYKKCKSNPSYQRFEALDAEYAKHHDRSLLKPGQCMLQVNGFLDIT